MGPINLDATQVVAVAAFLRVINALENIRSAIAFEEGALAPSPPDEQLDLLKLALADTVDAIDVLRGGGLHPDAVQKLEQASERLQLASKTKSFGKRKKFVKQAIKDQEAARGIMVDE